MSNVYDITIRAYVIADNFETAVLKYDAADYEIDSHSFDAPNGLSFDEQEQYVRDCWDAGKEPDWTEIKDPDGEDYK